MSVEQTVAEIFGAGARSVTPLVLHLRTGAREWYHAWLQHEHPRLVPLYEELYRHRAYAPATYQRTIVEWVRQAEQRHGRPRADRPRAFNFREVARAAPSAAEQVPAEQLTLL